MEKWKGEGFVSVRAEPLRWVRRAVFRKPPLAYPTEVRGADTSGHTRPEEHHNRNQTDENAEDDQHVYAAGSSPALLIVPLLPDNSLCGYAHSSPEWPSSWVYQDRLQRLPFARPDMALPGSPAMIDGRQHAEVSMTGMTALAVESGVADDDAGVVAARKLACYREYTLESSIASVVKLSRTRESEIQTRHQRPARIQELDWRPPNVRSGSGQDDPRRHLQFSFCDDRLFQVVVTYDRDRMDGLTADDVIESLAATYGAPSPLPGDASDGLPAGVRSDAAILARWESSASQLTLIRGAYPADFQLILISRTLHARALAAIKQALRLDTQEAQQRFRDQRDNEAADDRIASQKSRDTNKIAFRA